eukprot:1368371-Amorphochlora_amoeboformis.AAC.1
MRGSEADGCDQLRLTPTDTHANQVYKKASAYEQLRGRSALAGAWLEICMGNCLRKTTLLFAA